MRFVNQTRLAYLKYMTKVGELLGGGNNTRQQMEDVMELEKELAKVSHDNICFTAKTKTQFDF